MTDTPHNNEWSGDSMGGIPALMRRVNALQVLLGAGSDIVIVDDVASGEFFRFTDLGVLLYSHDANDGSLGAGGMAIADDRRVWISDPGENELRKYEHHGAFLVEFGSPGSGQGEFNEPLGIAIDSIGNIYVSDSINDRIQRFTGAGSFVLEWGSLGSGEGEFDGPRGIAIDSSGDIYVADDGNHRIQKFTNAGTFLAEFGTEGSSDGQLDSPVAVGIDAVGNIYVGESNNFRISKFTSAHAFVLKWGTSGSGDGQFSSLNGLAISSAGFVYVSDGGANDRIQKFDLLGIFIRKFGNGIVPNPAAIEIDESFEQTEWFKYTPSAVSLGVSDGGVSIPALDALDAGAAFVAPDHVTDVRVAVELLAPFFINAVTGDPFNWNGAQADSLYRLALGDRDTDPSDFGFSSPSPADDWDRMLAEMEVGGIWDIDIGELGLCLTLLEASAIV